MRGGTAPPPALLLFAAGAAAGGGKCYLKYDKGAAQEFLPGRLLLTPGAGGGGNCSAAADTDLPRSNGTSAAAGSAAECCAACAAAPRCAAAVWVAAPALTLAAALAARVQPILDAESRHWGNTSVSFAFRSATLRDTTVRLAAGYRAAARGARAAPGDLLLFGSATKMYTGVAVLRLVDRGVVRLDDRAAPHIDPVLSRDGGPTVAGLFGGAARNVTVAQLLRMESGIPDFDTSRVRRAQNARPAADIAPADLLRFAANRSAPGAGDAPTPSPAPRKSYSSTNYILLGYLLARHANATAWDRYDQSEVLRGTGLAATRFAVHGPPAQWRDAEHGYEPGGTDVYNMSALNGWTCGNLVATTGDVAEFVYNLFGYPKSVLPGKLVGTMVDFQRLDKVDGFTAWYGAAAMLLDPGDGHLAGDSSWNCGALYGHAGAAYGFYSRSGYNPTYDFSVSLAINHERSVFQENLDEIHRKVYDAVVLLLVEYFGKR